MNLRIVPKRALSSVMILMVAMCVGTGWSWAQVPDVPSEWLDRTRRVRGDALTFCVERDSMLRDVHVGIAEAIAAALLIRADIYEYVPMYPSRPFDYSLAVSQDEIYRLMVNECDVFTGLSADLETEANWLRTSRPVFETSFVLASRVDDRYDRLGDVPGGARVGARLMSVADIQLAGFVRTIPRERRWQRTQYHETPLLFERLIDGSIEAALFWEPALHALQALDTGEVGVAIGSVAPLPSLNLAFGLSYMANEAFLGEMINAAIEQAIEDGAVERVLDATGVPARAAGRQ